MGMITPSGLNIRIDLSRVPVPVILCESGALFLTCLPLSTLRLRSEYGFTNQIIFTAKTQRTLSDKKRGVKAGCVSEGSK